MRYEHRSRPLSSSLLRSRNSNRKRIRAIHPSRPRRITVYTNPPLPIVPTLQLATSDWRSQPHLTCLALQTTNYKLQIPNRHRINAMHGTGWPGGVPPCVGGMKKWGWEFGVGCDMPGARGCGIPERSGGLRAREPARGYEERNRKRERKRKGERE